VRSKRRYRIAFFSLIIAFNIAACGPTATQPAASRPQSKIALTPCRFPKQSLTLLCGKYDVFEDRAAESGRKIALNIVVLPASSANPAPDPVFFLAGGPGQNAAGIASDGEEDFMREIRRDRDVVFIDQRGTGKSNRLQCNLGGDRGQVQNAFLEMFPVDKVRACRKNLEEAADLRLYTTPLAMDDIDEVRAAMGYDRINLYGVSYGTLSALEYLRRHPQRIRSAALAGVATPAAKLPLHFAKSTQNAMDKLIEDCAADEVCGAAFPKLKAEFAAVLAALDGAPARFQLAHPVTKQPQPVILSRDVFVERLRLMLYGATPAALVPFLIHRAAQGNWVPFGRVVADPSENVASAISMGAYFTITCSESVALITEDEIVRETRNTFLGEYRTRRHIEACKEWPRGNIPPEYYAPVSSAVPVLMLSREFDPATPAEFGTAAAKSLPNSRQILIPGRAHSYGSECIEKLIAEFFSQASAAELDAGCTRDAREQPFEKELPERYR
jgi:pimeloyl-ACP methyl ester carboxylesterase